MICIIKGLNFFLVLCFISFFGFWKFMELKAFNVTWICSSGIRKRIKTCIFSSMYIFKWCFLDRTVFNLALYYLNSLVEFILPFAVWKLSLFSVETPKSTFTFLQTLYFYHELIPACFTVFNNPSTLEVFLLINLISSPQAVWVWHTYKIVIGFISTYCWQKFFSIVWCNLKDKNL